MQQFQWTNLNKQQLGRFYEQHVQMELTLRGFQLYIPTVDDHGVDLVARLPKGEFLELQIKAIRKPSYLFVRKKYFEPNKALHLVVGLHMDGHGPQSLLIPSQVWHECANDPLLSAVFCENDYKGLKSDPEYGLRLTTERFEALHERFGLDAMFAGMCRPILDTQFLRTVFCDAFIFSDQPHSYLAQHPELTRPQCDLALQIYASQLYPQVMDKIIDLSDALGDTFYWQSNSEGTQIFVAKILFLLERYGLDAAWFMGTWGPVDRSQRAAY